MSFETNTGATIQEAFEKYHAQNPQMYAHFKRLAFQALNRKRRKISFKMIMNVIRWEIFIATEDEEVIISGNPVKLKINDAYGSRYARLFIKEYPQYSDAVELRVLRAN